MPDKERLTLSRVRLERAEDCLTAAKQLVSGESFRSAANRAYYCAFHSMRAVLALDGIDMKHHSGIISEFRRLYVKTGTFNAKLSEIISALFDLRTESDYDDFCVISEEEALEAIRDAEFFLSAVKAYLEKS